ncbi:iron complex transport system substrate-binding protein [Kribbella steppae]|uniref:Iron complex transport system substrate-binding protein n=1 Tax=Kribbella steppae TaxID=2512223 RepID=A0A4R2H008_9ACTN|nr:iron-siderophore ABC transporter substrate-binding protein [Kribbella steppae]TCO17254.1 iron complex transport system substrate-binding protein [Kribbella steppae]
MNAGLPHRSWRRSLMVAVAALCATALAACGGGSSAGTDSAAGGGEAVTIQAATGAVELPKPAVRVAVMQWQFLENLLALGVQPVMIADEQQPGSGNPMPPQFEGKLGKYTSLGSRISPNLEVLSAEPIDLIVADKSEHLKDYEQFSQIAPTLILDTSSWTDFYTNLQKLGQAVGKADKAAEVEKSLKHSIAAGKTKLSAAAAKRVLIGVPTPDKFFAFTANSLQAGVLAELGLTYSYKEVAGKLSDQAPLESLAQTKADVMFLTVDPGSPVVTDTWKGNSLWDSIPAVQANQVHTVDRGIWSVGRGALSVPMMVQQTVDAFAKG